MNTRPTYSLIAEESFDFYPNESAHQELYRKYSKELNETARQLAILIAKTGFNDVTWRNIPIINEPSEFHGPRRVALIDLEHMNSAKSGFLGGSNGSRGLIRCVAEEQIDIVIAEAYKQGVVINDNEAKQAKDSRLKEIADNKQLSNFYTQNGIITGKEHIQVDLDSLGLDLTEEGLINVIVEVKERKIKWEKQTVTLRKVTEDVIAEMNKLIQNSSDQASTKGKRYFVLNTNDDSFAQYSKLGISFSKILINKEEENGV